MKQYNAIDLFCGAGGLSYGFESAGFNILLGIDSDQKALEVFEKNHKGSKSICGDITQISYDNIKELNWRTKNRHHYWRSAMPRNVIIGAT